MIMPFYLKELSKGARVSSGSAMTYPDARAEAEERFPGCVIYDPVETYRGCRFSVVLEGRKVAAIDLIKSPGKAFKGSVSGLELPRLSCRRCGHSWTPRNGSRLPKVCPSCKSPYWDIEKKK